MRVRCIGSTSLSLLLTFNCAGLVPAKGRYADGLAFKSTALSLPPTSIPSPGHSALSRLIVFPGAPRVSRTGSSARPSMTPIAFPAEHGTPDSPQRKPAQSRTAPLSKTAPVTELRRKEPRSLEIAVPDGTGIPDRADKIYAIADWNSYPFAELAAVLLDPNHLPYHLFVENTDILRHARLTFPISNLLQAMYEKDRLAFANLLWSGLQHADPGFRWASMKAIRDFDFQRDSRKRRLLRYLAQQRWPFLENWLPMQTRPAVRLFFVTALSPRPPFPQAFMEETLGLHLAEVTKNSGVCEHEELVIVVTDLAFGVIRSNPNWFGPVIQPVLTQWMLEPTTYNYLIADTLEQIFANDWLTEFFAPHLDPLLSSLSARSPLIGHVIDEFLRTSPRRKSTKARVVRMPA